MWFQRWLHSSKEWCHFLGCNVTEVALKNCASFIKCIKKINGATINNVEVMPMFNVLEYNSNYSETTSSLWFYSKDEATLFNNNIGNKDNFISFEFKDKL